MPFEEGSTDKPLELQNGALAMSSKQHVSNGKCSTSSFRLLGGMGFSGNNNFRRILRDKKGIPRI